MTVLNVAFTTFAKYIGEVWKIDIFQIQH